MILRYPPLACAITLLALTACTTAKQPELAQPNNATTQPEKLSEAAQRLAEMEGCVLIIR